MSVTTTTSNKPAPTKNKPTLNVICLYLLTILAILYTAYFAQNLIDYDPCQNNGGWQWSSSTGADSQPYFRIFNPWLQAKRFDPGALYIKRWIPELETVPAKDLLQWDKPAIREKHRDRGYPEPVVDYKASRDAILQQYKALLKP